MQPRTPNLPSDSRKLSGWRRLAPSGLLNDLFGRRPARKPLCRYRGIRRIRRKEPPSLRFSFRVFRVFRGRTPGCGVHSSPTYRLLAHFVERFGSVTAGQTRTTWNGSPIPPFTALGWLAVPSPGTRKPGDQRPMRSGREGKAGTRRWGTLIHAHLR